MWISFAIRHNENAQNGAQVSCQATAKSATACVLLACYLIPIETDRRTLAHSTELWEPYFGDDR